MKESESRVFGPKAGNQFLAFVYAMVVGGFVAISTVVLLATAFRPYKELMPIAFICAAILSSLCGIAARRSLLIPNEKQDDEPI